MILRCHTSLILLTILATFASCKTADQIKREKMVDSMQVQMVDGQKMTAKTTVRIQNLEERMSLLTGEMEEKTHGQFKAKEEKIAELEKELSVVKENQKNIQTDLDGIKTSLVEQRKYLDNLLKTLGQITGKKKKAVKKRKKRTPYEQALVDYRAKRYSKAKPVLLQVYHNKKTKGYKRERSIYTLGMLSYKTKKYDDSLTYFSKLYTEHKKSALNKSGLLYLGRSFEKMGQKDQAIAIYQELIGKYPKSRETKSAKKELKKLGVK